MRDFCLINNNSNSTSTKMAELKFEAPLAQLEEDEWGTVDYQSVTAATTDSLNYLNNLKENLLSMDNSNNNNTIESLKMNATNSINNNNINKLITKDNIDNFNEAFSGSLEDLVNSFDEKITKCFGNYEQSVEEIAPIQVRSQEEIMNECQ